MTKREQPLFYQLVHKAGKKETKKNHCITEIFLHVNCQPLTLPDVDKKRTGTNLYLAYWILLSDNIFHEISSRGSHCSTTHFGVTWCELFLQQTTWRKRKAHKRPIFSRQARFNCLHYKISLIFGPLNFHNPHPNHMSTGQDPLTSNKLEICMDLPFRLLQEELTPCYTKNEWCYSDPVCCKVSRVMVAMAVLRVLG